MATANHQIASKVFIKGYVVLRSGLCIGGTDTGLGVAGADRVVVRNPLTFRPYIPGSSLKGRMRSLMERLAGEFGTYPQGNVGAPLKKASTPTGQLVCDLFGVSSDDKAQLPGRLTVRDGQLVNFKTLEATDALDLPYTEIKTEAAIDRLTAKATPHHTERVPAGAVFALDMVVTAYQGGADAEGIPTDDLVALVKGALTGLRLVADDALGASGSRGYGKCAFHVQEVALMTPEAYLAGEDPKPYDAVPVPADLRLPEADLAAIESAL